MLYGIGGTKSSSSFTPAETALRVPLPGLVMIRVTASEKAPQYGVFAVKRRPENLDIPLFHAPIPNVFGSGAIC